MAINKNFVTTTEGFEGYKITKYLGPVFGVSESWFSRKRGDEAFTQGQESIMMMAGNMGANAIVGMKTLFGTNTGGTTEIVFYGTAVVIEPLSK